MHPSPARGMSLIDVIVGTALVAVIFLALLGMLRVSIMLSSLVKTEAAATAIANSQMEYIRSLAYSNVGTTGGIPNGVIPEYATTTEDGVNYGVRTFIDYYNDPADSSGNIDYKRIKVTVSYTAEKKSKQVTLISLYVPYGLNATSNGGTIEIFVKNATGNPLSGATVQIINASTSPAVNLTTFTNTSGVVDLPGAATSTQYDVIVSESGYSTAQTYARNTNNPNPSPGYLTVAANETTSATFQIDQLGTLTLKTYSPITTSSWSDNFANSSKLVALANTTAGGGTLLLSGAAGSYPSSGSAISTTTSPAYLYAWSSVTATTSVPTGTTAVVHVLDGSDNLIPDTVLPGNAAGFSSFPVSLSGVSTTTYPALALEANLTTASASSTPLITSWGISSQVGPTPLANVPFTLTGAKTIGTTDSGGPIYKTTVSTSTNSVGTNVETLEWDSYSLAVSGYDVTDACGIPPYALSPGASINESLILGPNTANSLLVNVTDGSGNLVPGATVTLTRTGYSGTGTSSDCGNAYFGGINADSDYTVTISAPGYTTTAYSNVAVSGDTYYDASF